MKTIEPPSQGVEPRWPVTLAVLVVLLLLVALPSRVRIFPGWTPFAFAALMLVPMATVRLTGNSRRWLRIEHFMTLGFGIAVGISNIFTLMAVVKAMLFKYADSGGIQLLESGAGCWVVNILAFSLVYWHSDRGGPLELPHKPGARTDWLFPQSSAPEGVPSDWRPTYVDYLALSFCTATAFSATDVLPMTLRAKLLLMLEALVSLVTIAMVASRAINIIGS